MMKMGMLNNLIKGSLLLVLSICAASCLTQNIKSQNITKSTIDSALIEWNTDSIGCLGLRSSKKLRQINDSLKLETKTKDQIEKILGHPNVVLNKNNNLYMRYYFNGKCQGNKLIDTLDYCWVDIIIKSGKDSVSIKYVCQ